MRCIIPMNTVRVPMNGHLSYILYGAPGYGVAITHPGRVHERDVINETAPRAGQGPSSESQWCEVPRDGGIGGWGGVVRSLVGCSS